MLTSALAHRENNNDSQRWRIALTHPRQTCFISFGFWLWGRPSGVEERAGAGSAPPAVTWAPSRSVFNRFPQARHYHRQTNLSFVRSRHISKHVCGNYFTAAPALHRSLLLGEECGKRRGNIYLSVDLKLIMILNSCSPLEPWNQFNVSAFECERLAASETIAPLISQLHEETHFLKL